MNKAISVAYDNTILSTDSAMEVLPNERISNSTKLRQDIISPYRNSVRPQQEQHPSNNKMMIVNEKNHTKTMTTPSKPRMDVQSKQNVAVTDQGTEQIAKPKRRVTVKATSISCNTSSTSGDVTVVQKQRIAKQSSSKILDGNRQLKVKVLDTATSTSNSSSSTSSNRVKSTRKKNDTTTATETRKSSSSSSSTSTETIKVKKSTKASSSKKSKKPEDIDGILPTSDNFGLRDIVWGGFKLPSSSRSVASSSNETSTVATATSSYDDLDDDDSCCSNSVAGSLAGSWVSKKSVQSAPGQLDSSKRRNSAGGTSLYSDRQKVLTDSKRSRSTSALNSLSLGEIQLSPFVRNTLRQKVNVSVKPLYLDDDLASTSTEKKSSTKKKVRFAKTAEGKIKAEPNLKSPSKLKLTPENIKKLWWTAEERHSMKRRAQRIGFRFLSVTAKYHLAVEQLLSKCMHENGTASRNPFFPEKEALRILINHDARGLELAMISALNLESCRHYHKCVKQSIVCVLNTQSMWKCSNMKSVDEQWQMIATELRQYSAFAKRFARILAEGDARIVRGHYDNYDEGGDVGSSASTVPSLCEESSLSTSSSDEADFQHDSFTI